MVGQIQRHHLLFRLQRRNAPIKFNDFDTYTNYTKQQVTRWQSRGLDLSGSWRGVKPPRRHDWPHRRQNSQLKHHVWTPKDIIMANYGQNSVSQMSKCFSLWGTSSPKPLPELFPVPHSGTSGFHSQTQTFNSQQKFLKSSTDNDNDNHKSRLTPRTARCVASYPVVIIVGEHNKRLRILCEGCS